MLKKIVTSLLTISTLVSSAYAVTIETDPQNAYIIISGNVAETVELKEVSVNILYSEKDVSDIISDGIDNVIAFSAQKPANEDGSFKITAKINGDSGMYTVFTDYEGNTDKSGKKVAFIKKEDNESAIQKLIDSTDYNGVATVLKEDMFLLNFSNEMYSGLDNVEVAKKYYGLMKEAPFTKSDFDKAQKCFDIACVLQAFAENKISDASEYFEIMDIANTDRISVYYKKDSETFKQKVMDVISAREYVNVGEFKATLEEAIVLAVVYQPDGNGEVKNVFTDFKDKIGIMSPSESVKIYATLAGNSYVDYNALRTAYTNAVMGNTAGGSTGGSGGSSGSGSGSGSSFVAGTPVNAGKTEIVEPIDTSVFKDLGSVSWAKDAIMALYDEGIIAGKDEGKFAPNESVTREQFVTMIVNAFNLKKGDAVSFVDVSENDWFYPYVNAAYNNNVTKGFGDSFGAGVEITRQDMAVMLYNVIINSGMELTEKSTDAKFSDSDKIAAYAIEAVSALKKAGVVNGMDDGRFEPEGISTRAQAAVMIYSVLKKE